MKTLCFDYYMQIDYSEEVSTCNFTIKCIPQTNSRQKVVQTDISLYPPTTYCTGTDGLKNAQIYGTNDHSHKMFWFRITGLVQTGLCAYEEEEDVDQSMIFRHPHGMNVPGEAIRKYYAGIDLAGCTTEREKAERIMDRLYEDYEYKPYETDVNTSAEEAFVLGHGVCQDYAHIFLALLHLAGISARYVTGLIVGEGASHAWVEVLESGKWYGYDPTNHIKVTEDHIKLGVGRDAHDCMINRGIMHGGGPHYQTIRVSVTESGETV